MKPAHAGGLYVRHYMTLTIHRHLRIGFILVWVVAWNAILGLGLALDHGATPTTSVFFAAAFALAGLSTSFLCLSVLFVPRMQVLALRPGTTIATVHRDLLFLAVLTGSLAVVSAVSVLLGGPRV